MGKDEEGTRARSEKAKGAALSRDRRPGATSAAGRLTAPPLPEISVSTLGEYGELLEGAILDWWRGRRPVSWSGRQHYETHAVNTSGPAEKRLAWVAAAIWRRRNP